MAHNKEEAMKLYADANYVNCRLSAYLYSNDNNNLVAQIIDFVMIDLDSKDFDYSQTKLNKALNKTLLNINKTFELPVKGFTPTVIMSGHGYHILLPVEPLKSILEDMPEFSTFKEPSKQLLRYLETYLSDGKCDKQHNNSMSFKNCMLRVPGSLNCKKKENGSFSTTSTLVKVIKNWSGQKVCIELLLLNNFLAHLIDKQQQQQESIEKHNKPSSILSKNDNCQQQKIDWIEQLLKTPIADYRKTCIWRILAPYLIIKRQLDFDQAYDIIEDWVARCSEIRPIDFDEQTKIERALNDAEEKGCYYPISFKKLKKEYPELYKIIVWGDSIRHK